MFTQSTCIEPVYRLRARTQLVHRNTTLFLLLGKRQAKIEPFDAAMNTFLDLIVSGGTSTSIHERFLTAANETEWLRAEIYLEQLLQKGFLEQVNITHYLDKPDLDRFDRLLHFFSEFEKPGYSRFDYLESIRKSKVGVIGTGGTGSWVIYNLLCCGVGYLRLIDGDKVEASNLNRSILYSEAEIGEPKVQAAARASQRFAPRTQIDAHNVFVSGAEMLIPYIEDLDLVIGVADQPVWLIKEWIAEACQMTGVPSLQASSVRVGPFFFPGKTSCSMCDWANQAEHNPHFSEIVANQRKLPKGKSGSISPWATLTAGMISLEVFRFLGQHSKPMTINAIWEMHGDGTTSYRQILPHSNCQVCGQRRVHEAVTTLRYFDRSGIDADSSCT